jgi:epsilon-lactone hydrolase
MSEAADKAVERVVEQAVDAVVARISRVYRGWNRSTPVEQMRRDWDELYSASAQASLINLRPISAGGVSAFWVNAFRVNELPVNEFRVGETRLEQPASLPSEPVLLFVHGGGFKVGSVRSHLELIAEISKASGCAVLGIDYRLAPEHVFPAALDDVLTAYEWLLAQGHAPQRIALIGDSAGAGLCVSAMLSLRARQQRLPGAAVLMSAWTDLSASGESYVSRASVDPINQRPVVLAMAQQYLGTVGRADDPLASPQYGELHGLPPLLMQVGSRETLLDDTRDFASKAQRAGVSVQLEVYPDMIHVFQLFPRDLQAARDAIASIGQFLQSHLAVLRQAT